MNVQPGLKIKFCSSTDDQICEGLIKFVKSLYWLIYGIDIL